MGNRLLLSIAAVLFTGSFVAGQEDIRLDLEFFEKGERIAYAKLGIADGETGEIPEPFPINLKLTPTRLEKGVAIDLEFEVGEETVHPRIKIRPGQPGSLTGPDGIEIRIALRQD